jgi:uncharacterized protein YkwD/uncharacterized membrane protein required for colicin V production
MNAVDIGILTIVGLFAVGGLRRGFLLGIIDLIAFGLALVVGARFAGSLAEPLVNVGLTVDLAAGAGFVIATVVSLAVIGFVARILVAPLGALSSATPLGWANGVLGLLPGAVRGLAFAALIVLLLSAFPAEFGLRGALASSRLADPIARAGRQALDAGLAWAGIDLQALGMPYQAPVSGTIDLPFSDITDLQPDPQAEQSLLALINHERALAGLTPLQADAALAEVGRQHGREMFALGYFGHTSPTTGSPADRLAAAGLDAALSGENIALAPTFEQAHEGLMNSPPHRANILNPVFTRVGVAALRSADHGLMVTQEFAGP